MRHHTTLLRAGLVASAIAAPSVALAERPTEEVAFYYNRIGFNYQHTSDQAPASANTLEQIGPAAHNQPAAPGDPAAPSGTLAQGDMAPIKAQGDMAKAAIQNMREAAARSLSTPLLTPIDPLPGAGQLAAQDVVMKGSNVGLNAAPSSKPKEIVVVGSKPPASDASRRAHPDYAWVPTGRPTSGDIGQIRQLDATRGNNVHRPAAPPPAVKAPSSQPQPYTLIELLPITIKGSQGNRR
jgi:hypothetical protein